MNNTRIAFPLAAVLLATCIFGFAREAAAGGMPDPVVGVIAVEPGEVTITQELNGRVTPFLIAEVRPQVNGIILDRLFEEGSDVKADQQLYQIDPAMYEAQLASAQAALAKAHANVDVSDAKLARYNRLVKANAVNQQEYDEVEAASKQAQAEVAIAEAQVRLAQINVDYARVLSPISGRLGKSSVTQGALVNANQANPLAVVQQLDPIYVDVARPVSSLLGLRGIGDGAAALGNTGKPHAEMRLVLDNGAVYGEKGEVLFADVTVDQTTGSISLRAEFPNPDNILLPGMYVTARLDVERIPDAITIPQRALMREHDGSAYVYAVSGDNTVSRRPVAAPRTIGEAWLVTEGLAAGDRIVVDGVQRIAIVPGAPAPRVNPVPATAR
ncbi:MAG: efflux RND transporter periplasmic adaptor subunit [Planctomycetota bacterium]|jgi:membrane fusion protein (multidrug efflux system)|nr:efflux RND transporter periplasmic adaptor subunit [Planctomycetota bacterium]